METKSNFKALCAEECAKRLLMIEKPVCFIHTHPDGDAVGSAAALAEIYRQLGISCPIASPDKIPERLAFILDKTGASVADDFSDRTPIAIDSASPSQLGSLYDEDRLPVLMIDHHKIGIPYADNFIIAEASSSAEVLMAVADELVSLGKIKYTQALAYALYTAISSDTGCFKYSNATESTHRAAARLISLGIDSADINHRLFVSKTLSEIKAEGIVAKKIKTALGGKVAYAAISASELIENSLELWHFETAIDVVRSLKDVEIAFFVKETAPGKYKASLRSTGIDVAKTAADFGGGGHTRAAGCSPEADSIDGAVKMLLEKLEQTFN